MTLVSVYCFAEIILSPQIGYGNVFLPSSGRNVTNHSITDTITKKKMKSEAEVSNSLHTFALGLNFGHIGKTGFSVFFNNNFSFLGTSTAKTKATYYINEQKLGSAEFEAKAKNLKGILWDGQLLFGHTWRQVPNLYISFGGGPGAGIGVMKTVTLEGKNGTVSVEPYKLVYASLNLGIALGLDVQYYFTKNIGLGISVTDTLGIGLGGFIYEQDQAGSTVKGAELLTELYPANTEFGLSNVFYIKIGPYFKF